VPPRNFTKRPATFESVPVAAAKADAPDSPVSIALTAGSDEPSAAQVHQIHAGPTAARSFYLPSFI
jgi:hypothetical protein